MSIEAVTEASVAKVASNDALKASKLVILPAADPEKVLKEEVKTKEVESKPSKNSAVVAYEAEVIDPEILIPPVAVILPVT